MANRTKSGERGRGDVVPSAGGPIGEAGADDFAADVAGASGGEAVVPAQDDEMAGAHGGGTGIGDLSGGTGIGTDDAGGDAGSTGTTAAGGR